MDPPECVFLSLPDGELARRAVRLREIMRCCALCPRECRVDRSKGEIGACGIGADAIVSSYGAHFGEESVLVGRYGSGTIFLSGCNLACVFCQNYDISQERRGQLVSRDRLADVMMELQDCGCHNINLVSPTHQVAHIIESLEIAVARGLRIPIVYNCGGYEPVQVLKTLDGIVDIYMPDAKYGSNEPGMKHSGVPEYWDRCREALAEMHRQVGDLDVRSVPCDEGGTVTVAVRGLLVRHLVLPNGLAHTREVVDFLGREIGRETFVNVMAQYRPQYHASEFPELGRQITVEEYREAVGFAIEAGLHRFAD